MKTASVILVVMGLSTICLGYLPADFNRDRIVDFYDFATFSDEWLNQDVGPDSNSVVYTVAASDVPNSVKVTADYVCDGIDDQIEIQTAIDALSDSGGKVLLLGGQYNVNKTGEHYSINLRSRTTLEGLGWGTVIRLIDNADATVIRGYNIERAVIRDLAIDGNKNVQTPIPDPNRSNFPDMWTNGINLKDSNECHVSNVYVKDTLMHGITIWEYSCRNIVENCLVENIGRDIGDDYFAMASILIFKYSDDNVVKNCRCKGPLIDAPSAPRGLYVSYHCNGNLIDGNVLTNFQGSSGGGIYFLHDASRRNKFINNNVYNCYYGIKSSTTSLPGSCNIINGNRFENCSCDGIAIRQGESWIITDNIIDNTIIALLINQVNKAIISENQLVATEHSGIYIGESNNDIQISNNIIDSNGYAIYINEYCSSSMDIFITNNYFESGWEIIRGDLDAISEISGNVGFTTENSGSAVITADSNSVVVNHGLDLTPTDGDIIVVPTNSMSNAVKFYVGTYTSTQFTITLDQPPGAATATFAWKAKVKK